MTYPVKHFSASSASTYLQCPAKWKYRYIDRLPETKSEALEKGTMVHKALERYWTGGYGKPEQGVHRFISAYRRMDGAVLPEQGAEGAQQPPGDDVVGVLAAQPGDMISRIGVGIAGDGMTAGASRELGFAGGGIASGLRGAGQDAADPQDQQLP